MANATPREQIDAIVEQAMHEAGFATDPPPNVVRAAEAAQPFDARGNHLAGLRDLRMLLWSSIDNPDSRDLDQLEMAERLSEHAIRLRIAIADVDALVPAGSQLDAWAAYNATSVYAGVETFPMLPENLSTNLTSLAVHEDRLALVISFVVGSDGLVEDESIERAVVHNHAKLDYETVGTWLEDHQPVPDVVVAVPGWEEKLQLQAQAAGWLRDERERRGALQLETSEARPVLSDGMVVDLAIPHKNPARLLIEDCMVAANGVVARSLERAGYTSLQRVIKTPERWPRLVALAREHGSMLPDEPDVAALAAFLRTQRASDPDSFDELSLAVVKLLGSGEYQVAQPGESAGHFALATHEYTHATAPNRRYADLAVQRILKAALHHNPSPYDIPQLEAIAERCNDRQQAARSVERLGRKVAAAGWMATRIGEVFRGVVTGVSNKGTFIRLMERPIEGKLVRSQRELDVGDRVRARLVDVQLERGWIDFEEA
jgi:exoribonuclease-2